MYFRARYYDPETGEFISRDPLEYVDGMSLYRGYFAAGGVDPFGLMDNPAIDRRADGLATMVFGSRLPTKEETLAARERARAKRTADWAAKLDAVSNLHNSYLYWDEINGPTFVDGLKDRFADSNTPIYEHQGGRAIAC